MDYIYNQITYMHHELKIKWEYWVKILDEEKNYEIRFNDRDYKIWDTIGFYEILNIPSEHELVYIKYFRPHYIRYSWRITHVLHFPEGLKDGWVVLSLKKT